MRKAEQGKYAGISVKKLQSTKAQRHETAHHPGKWKYLCMDGAKDIFKETEVN